MNDEMQREELAALVENWREAEESHDRAALEAFEDELHERVTIGEIGNLGARDPGTRETPAPRDVQLRSALEEIWHRADARLG